MKHSEYALFFDPTLNPMARNLYMALRYCVDYKTGIVCVPYSRLIELISFQPPSKSSAEPIRPTIKQIRVWLSSLEERGLIEKREDGNASKGASASWFLPQIIKGTYQGHIETQQPQGLQAEQGHNENPQQGHISVLSDKNNIYGSRATVFEGEVDDGLSANEITLDNQFILAARSVGQALPFEELNLIFIDFQNNKHNRHKFQGRADWLADWRSWCAKSKLYHRRSLTNATNKHYGNHSKPVNKAEASRNIFEFARAAAAKLAASED